MSNNGFEEARAVFHGVKPVSLAGEVRRFGPHGPAYEVLDVRRTGDLAIIVIESGERLDYPLGDFLADPIAETVP